MHTFAPCRLLGCKNRPGPFLDRMSYKATKPGSVFSLSLDILNAYIVLLTRAPYSVVLFWLFLCYVSWLFLLACQTVRTNASD